MALSPDALMSLSAQLHSGAVLFTLPFAWILGRGPEKTLAIALSSVGALNLLWQAYLPGQTDPVSFRPDQAILDGLVLSSLVIIAMRANRLYPIVMAGAALITMLAHILRWLELFDGRLSYVVLTAVPAHFLVGAFWTGLALHVWRQQQWGPYPEWRSLRQAQTIAVANRLG